MSDELNPDEGAIRYAAYANRIRTIMSATHRYVAYTSDIGESFRPVAHPNIVRAGYAVSWGYIIGDVVYDTWKCKMKQDGVYKPGLKPWDPIPTEPNLDSIATYKETNLDWKLSGLKRLLFQSLASMGLPAFTIHTIVRYMGQYVQKSGMKGRTATLLPVVTGLAIVPALPYIFDEPVEKALDTIFDEVSNKIKEA